MTKSTQKKEVNKLHLQTKAEKLLAKRQLALAPSRETWTNRMSDAFNVSYHEGKKAKLPWGVFQRMGYLAAMEEQKREFEENRKKDRKVREMIRDIKDDFARGKISPETKKRTIDTINKTAEEYFKGEKKFKIIEVQIRDGGKVKKGEGISGWKALTLTESGDNDVISPSDWSEVMKPNGFMFIQRDSHNTYKKDNPYKGRNKNEIDVVINEVNFRTKDEDYPSSHYKLCLNIQFGDIFLKEANLILSLFNEDKDLWNEIIKINDIDKPVFGQKIEQICSKTGISSQQVVKALTLGLRDLYLNTGTKGVQDVHVGMSTIRLVKFGGMFYELEVLRSEEGIKKASESGELTKLYSALFPHELISLEEYKQAIKDNVDFWKVINGFEYAMLDSLESNDDEIIPQRYEMKARLLQAQGNLDMAEMQFDKACDSSNQRYKSGRMYMPYIFGSQFQKKELTFNWPLGKEIYQALGVDFEKQSCFEEAITCYKKAYSFLKVGKKFHLILKENFSSFEWDQEQVASFKILLSGGFERGEAIDWPQEYIDEQTDIVESIENTKIKLTAKKLKQEIVQRESLERNKMKVFLIYIPFD